MNKALLFAVGAGIGLLAVNSSANIVENANVLGTIDEGVPVTTPIDNSAKNLAAFLMVIRKCEGTGDEGGWARLFGGGSFIIGNDHPRILVKKSGYNSTAAGAFQINAPTWDDFQDNNPLPDFSPASQTEVAVRIIKFEGAYDDVLAGNFYVALSKVANRWASLPGATDGQPTRSLAYVEGVYLNSGGVIT